MRSRSEFKLIVGALIWIGLISGGALIGRHAVESSNGAATRVAQFLSTPRRQVELKFSSNQIFRVGTPIFLEQGDLSAPIGRITRVESADSTETSYVYSNVAYAELFAHAPELSSDLYLTFHETPEAISWVVEMMLPPKTREKIGKLILDSYREHQKEIVTAFRPIVEKSLADATEIIREDLRVAIANREEEFSRLGEKFQAELIEKEIVPLVRNEIWPVVQNEARPLVNEIGQEIWAEVSVWRFTWKYIYDRSPLPERNLAKKEFDRFVDDKAVPILESHIGDLIKVQQEILKKVSQNDKVKATVGNSIRKIMQDDDVQRIVTEVFQEVFVNNPRLQDVLEKNWQSPEAQSAIAMTNKRLEPMITGIGEIMFGSPDKQITPEFSRVLRHKILKKDDRWLVMHVGKESENAPKSNPENRVLTVMPGTTSTENPFHIPAQELPGIDE